MNDFTKITLGCVGVFASLTAQCVTVNTSDKSTDTTVPTDVITEPVTTQPVDTAPIVITAGDYHPTSFTTLIFQDEFNTFDRSKWCTRMPYGGGPALQVDDADCKKTKGGGTLDFLNNEQQRYRDTNTQGIALHTITDGVLNLSSTKTYLNNSWVQYESAMVRSKQLFAMDKPLYFVARINPPDVIGSWPAFWLIPTDGWPPEIDIADLAYNGKDDKNTFFHLGAIPSNQKANVTYKDSKWESTWSNWIWDESLKNRWITIGAQVNTDSICYYLYAEKTESLKEIPNTKIKCEDYSWKYKDSSPALPANIIINLAMGGDWAGRYGIAGPATFKIDYVRAYQ